MTGSVQTATTNSEGYYAITGVSCGSNMVITPPAVTDDGIIYKYVGYRINTDPGTLKQGNPSIKVSDDITINYYYAWTPVVNMPTYADREIVLNLDIPAAPTGVNAFTAGVSNLDPSVTDYAVPLGVLEGQVSQSSKAMLGNTGYFTFTGTYAGALPTKEKTPKLHFIFIFTLLM